MNQAPASGLMREVLFQQATLAKDADNIETAQRLLERSGYNSFERPIGLSSGFSISRDIGLLNQKTYLSGGHPQWVYQVTGYDFMEHFRFLKAAKNL